MSFQVGKHERVPSGNGCLNLKEAMYSFTRFTQGATISFLIGRNLWLEDAYVATLFRTRTITRDDGPPR